MSEEIDTAFAEYQQELLVRPGTFCAYCLAMENIVDLCDPAIRKAIPITEETLFCPWKEILLVQKRKPPSWEVAEKVSTLKK
ncbi:hypothetical protein [Candidatus Cyanaurora vandensis]|uniref:hypothetical protein n=1 Tax=Candidatus Cyanaurora vandensis TaxID=2714958 RepID=UPI00257E48F7|nr:hypothetical protein [Candidatus Cyanaurora vandensis]